MDLSLASQKSVHSTGTYPVPKLSETAAVTTILNLGREDSEIVGQLHWEGGTYALGPIWVPANGGALLDFRSIAESEKEDLLGSTLPIDLEQGFFHWRVRSGSRDLLARTDIRDLGAFDSFGINCNECCPELPWGDILPGPIGFNREVPTDLSAVEMISTCNGPMGPFPIFPSSLSYTAPVTWTGQTITSTDYTRQRVAFSESRERLDLFCIVRRIFIGDDEEVVVDECLKEHGPEGYDPRHSAGGCPGQTTSCDGCFGCCEQLKDVANCRCDELPGQSNCSPTLSAEACGLCKKGCLTKFDLTTCSTNAVCVP